MIWHMQHAPPEALLHSRLISRASYFSLIQSSLIAGAGARMLLLFLLALLLSMELKDDRLTVEI